VLKNRSPRIIFLMRVSLNLMGVALLKLKVC
jgi:hypothetical protein